MTDTTATRPRVDAPRTPAATGPRWIRIGFAAVLGTVAGTMLFASRAEGRAGGRERT